MRAGLRFSPHLDPLPFALGATKHQRSNQSFLYQIKSEHWCSVRERPPGY